MCPRFDSWRHHKSKTPTIDFLPSGFLFVIALLEIIFSGFSELNPNRDWNNFLFDFRDILSVATLKPTYYTQTRHAVGCKMGARWVQDGCKIMEANCLIMSTGCKKCKIF